MSIRRYRRKHREVVVEEGWSDRVFGVVVYAGRLGIMPEHVRQIFRPLEMSIASSFN
jgi:hypothetical protein